MESREERLRYFGAMIGRLIRGENLSREETRECWRQICTEEQPDLSQGAFIAALKAKPETPEEVAGTFEALYEYDTIQVALETQEPLIDNCEALMAVRYGASAVGLVSVLPHAPGSLPEARIADIAARLPPGVASFLVTVYQEGKAIIAQQRRCRVNTVQLGDYLTDGTHQELRAALPGIHIVQIIPVIGEEALQVARRVAPQVDGRILDSGSRDQPHKAVGGTGRTHDWCISRRVCDAVEVPVFLAGGLTPTNVADAIRQVRPYGVDLCSGVRTDGRLDEEKVRAFFAAVNGASAA